MAVKKIKIIFADDHALFRQGIIELLKRSPFFEVLDEVDSGEKLIESYFRYKPDIAIIDIAMPGISGYEAFEKIKERDRNVRALFLSMHTEEIYYYQIYSVGGMGLVGKNIHLDELESALQAIMLGKVYFGKDYTQKKLDELVARYNESEKPTSKDGVNLTETQIEILRLIATGNTSNEIADVLNISKRTVDKQREIIKKRINAGTLMEIYKFAIEYFKDSE